MLRIRELREDKDKKQIEIAELLGIQQNSYSQIENGINTIQVDHLIRLASLYVHSFFFTFLTISILHSPSYIFHLLT